MANVRPMSDGYDPTYPHWSRDPNDGTLVRWWDGDQWEAPIDPEVAMLNQIAFDNAELKSDIDTIRYRVGFLALSVLMSILASLGIFVWSVTALRAAGL